MKLNKRIIFAIAAAAFLSFGAVSSHAADHPHYLHALSDLRLQRSYLDRPAPSERVDEESQRAITEIDAAIHEIKEAAIEDGKNVEDEAPVDAHITLAGRFRKAREAGNAAWHDINQEEDNGYARGLKHRALEHIEAANHIIDHIIKIRHYEEHED